MLLSLSHAMAALVVFETVLPLALAAAVFISILLSLSFYLAREFLLLSPDSWQEISLDRGSVSVVTRAGQGFSGQVSSKTTVSPYFVVLSVLPEGRRLPVTRTILPDSLGTGEFRELCVRLRFSQ
jgi:hypothetical protein